MFTATIGIGRRTILAVMVVTLCAVANSAGPASAILMIPSIQTIDRAGFDFFLNGTSDDLWPSTLESRHIGGSACINTEAAATDASCIGGGYPAIHNHFTAFEQRPASTSFNFDTEDRLGQRTILGNIRMAWPRGSETWAQLSHAATIMIAEPIRARWSYCLRYLTNIWAKRYDFSDNRGATVETEVPAVRVACVPTQNLSSQSSVAFPVLEEYENWYLPTAAEWKTDGQDNSDVGVTANFDIGNFSAQLQNSFEALNSAFTVRTQWIILPKQFKSTSAGLLVDISSRLEDTSTYNPGMACSIDACWARGTTSMSGTQTGWAYASYGKPTVSEISHKRSPPDGYAEMQHFLPIDDGSWRRIAMTPPWLLSLTPPVPDSRSTTLETILAHTIPAHTDFGFPPPYIASNSNPLLPVSENFMSIPVAEHIISVVVTDGISRVGCALQPNASTIETDMFGGFTDSVFSLGQVIPPPPKSAGTTQMRLSTTIDGYVYRIVGGTGAFTVIVIVAHMLIVLVHSLMIVFRRAGRWSDSWESFSEVLALAMNSPAGVSGETAAGIKKFETLALMVKIRAVDGAEGGAVDGVGLVVGGSGGNEVQNGVAYGNPATTP